MIICISKTWSFLVPIEVNVHFKIEVCNCILHNFAEIYAVLCPVQVIYLTSHFYKISDHVDYECDN